MIFSSWKIIGKRNCDWVEQNASSSIQAKVGKVQKK